MAAAPQRYKMQALNAFLRAMPLAAKMVLTFYMGHYFSLAEIGRYGLVFGAASIWGVVLGQGFHYIVARDVVGVSPLEALHKMRDQAVFYGVNYFVMAVGMCALAAFHLAQIDVDILFFIFILTLLESFGFNTYANMNSMNQQVAANALFFVRSGLWVVPVLIQCTLDPAARTASTVLTDWAVGSFLGLLVTFWWWRDLPWREVRALPVDWRWIAQGIRRCWLIWVGMLGLTCGTFVDRFVVEHYLNLDYVGILTFYFSFTNAMLTLMQSGVMAFATPRLIQHHRSGDADSFRAEARQARRQIVLGSAAMAVLLGIFVPLCGYFLGRPALVAEAGTLWLMLFATWLRADAELFNNVLFARHQDRAVWLGNLLFLIPALGGNLLLVPIFGFSGLGYSSVIACAFLLAWRWWCASRPAKA